MPEIINPQAVGMLSTMRDRPRGTRSEPAPVMRLVRKSHTTDPLVRMGTSHRTPKVGLGTQSPKSNTLVMTLPPTSRYEPFTPVRVHGSDWSVARPLPDPADCTQVPPVMVRDGMFTSSEVCILPRVTFVNDIYATDVRLADHIN